MEHIKTLDIHKDHSRAINAIGGTVAVAKLCEVSPQAVSKWRRGTGIPKAQLKYLREIRPKAFISEAA